MPAAVWCDGNDVKEHLGDSANAKGWTDANLDEKIQAAQGYLTGFLNAAVGSSVVAGWAAKSLTPPAVVRLTGMLAAVRMLESYGGQSIGDELSEAGSLWLQIKAFLNGLADGTVALTDPTGGSVAARIPYSTTERKTPTLTTGNDGDGSTGSLDNY